MGSWYPYFSQIIVSAAGPSGSALQLETGSYLLLETGSFFLLG